MASLQKKVAIITGASSGIGRATAILFAAEGASVVLNARGADALEEVVDAIRRQGGTADAVTGDVGLAETHEKLVHVATRRFGGLDVAINNAATIGPIKPLADVTLQEWQDTLAANLTSAFLSARYQIPAMLEKGMSHTRLTPSCAGRDIAPNGGIRG